MTIDIGPWIAPIVITYIVCFLMGVFREPYSHGNHGIIAATYKLVGRNGMTFIITLFVWFIWAITE